MLNEFITRSCPCCNKPLKLSDRLALLNREPLNCKYCAKPLKPNVNITLFNVFWLSMSISWLIKNTTSLNYLYALAAALFTVSVFLPALDLLFTLEPDESD